MADEVYMNVPAVREMASGFGAIGEVLQNVAKVLDVLSNMLKVSAFVGLVGASALAQIIDTIKPHIKRMGDKCAELKKDLSASVDAFERGDQQGAQRFY